MFYNKYVTVLFFYSIFISYSQDINLKGVVKDSFNTPLSFANIIAKPKDVKQKLHFAITDEKGQYQIKLKRNETYTLNISFMGYRELHYTISSEKDSIKNFVLEEAKNILKEVVIELPITIKEDTTIYNVKHFVTGGERKLKNVLKKLPGVEVDRNGNVMVHGKKVTKMLVEGKKFFGGGTKLAVENIPANAIDKVTILDNYNEVSFLKNFSDSNEMAMNVQLKEDKKRFVFGDLEVGRGNKDFYKTHTNLFYYSPKTNINFIGALNNIGAQSFTFEDYLNFSGGLNAVFSGNFSFKNNDYSRFIQNQDVITNHQRFSALNFTKITSDKLEVSGYIIFLHSNSENFLQTINEYSLFTENKKNRNTIKNVLGIGKLDIEYTPSFDEQWYIRTQVKKNNSYKKNAILSEVNTTTNTINADANDGGWYMNQNVEWHKKQSENHTFSAITNYTYNKNNPISFWKTTEPILQNFIPVNDTLNQLQFKQLKETEKHNLHIAFKDFWALNRHHHIYSTVGNLYKQEKFFSEDEQVLDTGVQNSFSPKGFNNRTIFKLNDFFLGLHYKFRTGIFTFKQGIHLHKYDWKVKQLSRLRNRKVVFLPDFLLKIEFNKSKKIQLNYNLKSNFSEASKLANRFYLQSYNSVFKGNETLENELFHSARIRYSRFSLYRGLLINASVSYIKKINGYSNTVKFDGVNQFQTVQMIANPNENWSLNVLLRKRIKNIRYKFSGNYKKSRYLQGINRNLITNKNENYSINIGAETTFDNFPNIELGLKRSINNFMSNSTTSQFITDEPYINVNYNFLKDFLFSYDFTHFNYRNKQQNLRNTYSIANTTLSYKKEDSAWSFKIEAQNLLDTQFKQSNRFSDYLISDTKTFILPRIFMFSIGYDL